jgi:predicted lipid-binding transport protein (Tim44 family)
MPGVGVGRQVVLIKVCLAVIWLGWCSPVPAGVGPIGDTFAHISQWRASATPAKAGRWSASRHRQANSPDQSSPKSSHNQHEGTRGLMDFLSGGLLGGVLWSILFGYPLSLYWSLGNWRFGFLDLMALTTAVYVGYRLLRPSHFPGEARPVPGFRIQETMGPAVFTINNEVGPGLARFSQADPAFDLQAFVEYARQMIFDLHEAWNREDLDKIKDRVTEPMLEALRVGLKIISLRGEISRVEDLALSQIIVEAASQGEGWDTITVRFQGRVVDYVLERCSFKLVSGSMSYPERLQELWIFERPRGQQSWLLADIQDPLVLAEVKPFKAQ